mmetsp:Transcript_4847/g.17236  ORF Transcript_4847/g.17236 Transcript_4847/m.17236 type:complete len:230 (+) Transcript_4847:1217-1906(+)
MGCAGRRGAGHQPCGHAQAQRQEPGLRRAGRGCRQTGRAQARVAEAQGRQGFPLHRQAGRLSGGRRGDRHRPLAVRHRHAAARHALRRDRPAAGVWRQGQIVRRGGRAEAARRRQGVRDRRHASAGRVPAAGRRGRRGQGHLGRHQGPRGLEDRLGRWAACRLRLGGLPQGAGGGGRQASRQGGAQRRRRGGGAGPGGQACGGRLLRAPSGPRDDGAAGRDGTPRRRPL